MVIFDTTVLIELYRGNTETKEIIEEIKSDIFYVSSITVAEFLVGARDKEELFRIKKQIKKYTVIPINSDICDLFLSLFEQFALSHRLAIADTLIASTALYYNLPVLTHNKKHFQYIPDLILL